MNLMSSKKYIQLGKVGKAHGLKGAFFVSGRDEGFPEVDKIYIGSHPESGRFLAVRAVKWQSERSILEVDSIVARESAEALLHQDIWIERAQLPLEDDECLWIDLEGSVVFTSDQHPLGQISEVANYGASDIVEIVKDKKRLSLPLIEDYFKFPLNPERLEVKQDLDFFTDLWEENHET